MFEGVDRKRIAVGDLVVNGVVGGHCFADQFPAETARIRGDFIAASETTP